MKKSILALLCLILLVSLLALGGTPVNRGVLAQAPRGGVNTHLWQRLSGMIAGPWVGQIDPAPAAKPGETYDLLIYYSNNGPAIQDISLVNYLPVGASLESVSAQPPIQWEPDEENHAIVVDLGDMPADDPGGTIHIVVRVNSNTAARQKLVNTVILVSEGEEQDRSVTAPTVVQAPDFSCTITGPTDIQRCTNIEYTVEYTNRGNLGAVDVTMAITLPIGVIPLSAIPAPTVITKAIRVCPGIEHSSRPEIALLNGDMAQLPQSLVYQHVLRWEDVDPLNIDDSQTLFVRARVQQNCGTYPGIVGTFSTRVNSVLNPLATVSRRWSMQGTMQAGPCPIFLPYANMHYDQVGSERDAQEYDDLPELANTVAADGNPSEHTLHKPGDEDWLRFLARPGYSYLVEVYDLEGTERPDPVPAQWVPRTDTVLKVYEPKLDPLSPYITGTMIYEGDDADFPNDFGSSYTIESNTFGYYYLRIESYGPCFPQGHPWKYDWPIDCTRFGVWPKTVNDRGYKVRITTVETPTLAFDVDVDIAPTDFIEPFARGLTRRAR